MSAAESTRTTCCCAVAEVKDRDVDYQQCKRCGFEFISPGHAARLDEQIRFAKIKLSIRRDAARSSIERVSLPIHREIVMARAANNLDDVVRLATLAAGLLGLGDGSPASLVFVASLIPLSA